MKTQKLPKMKPTNSELIGIALDAMKKSYSPYSHFTVGAALECSDGTVYTGCNIENAAFTPTNCAERTAFFKAVSEGRRDFVRIAVVGGKNGIVSSSTAPCGVCRQVMREFCKNDFAVLMYDGENIAETTLGDLLPDSFGPDDL